MHLKKGNKKNENNELDFDFKDIDDFTLFDLKKLSEDGKI